MVEESILDSFPNKDERSLDLLSDNLLSGDRRNPLNNSLGLSNIGENLSPESVNKTNPVTFDDAPLQQNVLGVSAPPPMPELFGATSVNYVTPQLYDVVAEISRVAVFDTFKKVTIDGATPQISDSTIDFSLNNNPRSSSPQIIGSSFSVSDSPIVFNTIESNNNNQKLLPSLTKQLPDTEVDSVMLQQQSNTITDLMDRLSALESFIRKKDASFDATEATDTPNQKMDVKTSIVNNLRDIVTDINNTRTQGFVNDKLSTDVKTRTVDNEVFNKNTQDISTRTSDSGIQKTKEQAQISDTSEDTPPMVNPNARALKDSSETANPNARALKDSSETANPNARALKDSSETANPNSRALNKDDKNELDKQKTEPEKEGTQPEAKEAADVFPIIMTKADLSTSSVAYIMSAGQENTVLNANRYLFKKLDGDSKYNTNEYWFPNVFPIMPDYKGVYILGLEVKDSTTDKYNLKWVSTENCGT